MTRAHADDTPTDPSGLPAEGSVAFGATATTATTAATTAAATTAAATEDRPDRVIPTWTDPVAVQASEAIGGPWGRHAVTGRALFWTPLRVCLLFTTLVLALAWVKQAPCASGNWAGSIQYTHFCYTDAIPLYGIHGLDRGQLPYLDSNIEYPVLTGGFMQMAVTFAGGYEFLAGTFGVLPQVPPVESYYVATCLLLSLCMLFTTRAVLALSGRRPWDAAMAGLSPLLLFHAFTNWDVVAVALATLGMWAWARSRPVVAGVLLGLGVAAKLYPVLLLGVLLVLCLRAARLKTWLSCAVAAAIAWLVVNVPIALLAPEGWSTFFRLSDTRPANPETLWNLALTLTDHRILDGPLAEGQTPSVLNAAVAVCSLAVAVGVGWLALAAPLRPRVPQLAFVLVAGFLLVNKVWSPQYSLWLLPLLVLARPRWRSQLLWQATEVLVWIATLLFYLGSANRGIEVQWFFTAVLVRDAAVVVLIALVVRDVLRPDGDLVRRSWPGVDDPAGGVLDHAPDRWVLHGFRPRRSAPQSAAEELDLPGVRGGVAGGLQDHGAAGGPRDLEQ